MLDMLIVAGLTLLGAYTGYTWGYIHARLAAEKASAQEPCKDTETDTLNWLCSALESIKIESGQVLDNGATPNGYEAKNIIRLAELAQGVITNRLGEGADGP